MKRRGFLAVALSLFILAAWIYYPTLLSAMEPPSSTPDQAFPAGQITGPARTLATSPPLFPFEEDLTDLLPEPGILVTNWAEDANNVYLVGVKRNLRVYVLVVSKATRQVTATYTLNHSTVDSAVIGVKWGKIYVVTSAKQNDSYLFSPVVWEWWRVGPTWTKLTQTQHCEGGFTNYLLNTNNYLYLIGYYSTCGAWGMKILRMDNAENVREWTSGTGGIFYYHQAPFTTGDRVLFAHQRPYWSPILLTEKPEGTNAFFDSWVDTGFTCYDHWSMTFEVNRKKGVFCGYAQDGKAHVFDYPKTVDRVVHDQKLIPLQAIKGADGKVYLLLGAPYPVREVYVRQIDPSFNVITSTKVYTYGTGGRIGLKFELASESNPGFVWNRGDGRVLLVSLRGVFSGSTPPPTPTPPISPTLTPVPPITPTATPTPTPTPTPPPSPTATPTSTIPLNLVEEDIAHLFPDPSVQVTSWAQQGNYVFFLGLKPNYSLTFVAYDTTAKKVVTSTTKVLIGVDSARIATKWNKIYVVSFLREIDGQCTSPVYWDFWRIDGNTWTQLYRSSHREGGFMFYMLETDTYLYAVGDYSPCASWGTKVIRFDANERFEEWTSPTFTNFYNNHATSDGPNIYLTHNHWSSWNIYLEKYPESTSSFFTNLQYFSQGLWAVYVPNPNGPEGMMIVGRLKADNKTHVYYQGKNQVLFNMPMLVWEAWWGTDGYVYALFGGTTSAIPSTWHLVAINPSDLSYREVAYFNGLPAGTKFLRLNEDNPGFVMNYLDGRRILVSLKGVGIEPSAPSPEGKPVVILAQLPDKHEQHQDDDKEDDEEEDKTNNKDKGSCSVSVARYRKEDGQIHDLADTFLSSGYDVWLANVVLTSGKKLSKEAQAACLQDALEQVRDETEQRVILMMLIFDDE